MTFFSSRSVSVLLVALGAAISGYLLWRQFFILGIWPGGGADVCATLLGLSCDAALRDPVSVQLGLPLASWGMIYYLTLAAFLVLGRFMGEAFELEAHVTALALSVLGGIVSLFLIVVMLQDGRPLCPLCATALLINLCLVPSLKRLSGRSFGEMFRGLAGGFRYLATGRTDSPERARWKLIGFAVPFLVAMLAYQWMLLQTSLDADRVAAAINPDRVLSAFAEGDTHDIPVSDDDPTRGPSDAAVQLVMFSDFQCPWCRVFVPALSVLGADYPGELQIVYKHFPLDKACNSLLRGDLHPEACDAAYSAEAARMQGRFWDYHDRLFDARLRNDDGIFYEIAERSGLDLDRFESDRRDAATLAKVSRDIELALRLGVDSTPTVFLNGRRVLDTRPQAVRILIDHELSK